MIGVQKQRTHPIAWCLMPYAIRYTLDAKLDLADMPKRDSAFVRDSITRYLSDAPMVPSQRRKELGSNPLAATWELRLGELRVYDDVDTMAQCVNVLRVGRKLRERVYIRNTATDLRR